MLANSLRQIGSINLTIELPKEALAPMNATELRQSLVSTAHSVAHATTKFQVAWKNIAEDIAGGQTSSAAEDGRPFAEGLEQDLKNLVVAANVVIALNENKWGQRVLQGVREAVAGVLNAVEALFVHFYEWKKGQVDAESAQLTAKVWEKCVAVEKVPLDNNTVACNAIRNWMGAIKDAMSELGELAAKKPKAKEEGEEEQTKKKEEKKDEDEDDEDEDEWDEDDDDDDEALSEEEAKVVPGCQLLIKSLFGLLNGSLPLLDLDERRKDKQRELEKQAQPQDDDDEKIEEDEHEWLEELVEKARALSEFADELVISLYPPQDPAVVRQHADKLGHVGRAIIGRLDANPAVLRRERFGRLRGLVETMLDKALADVTAAQAQA